MTEPTQLDIHGVLRLLPHRFPFMLVDRVLEWHSGKSIRALKSVTYNEPYFTGHFPERPVMPGVLIIEALAQAAGILTLLSSEVVPDDSRFFFVGIDRARFRKPVEPGDQLILEAEVERCLRGIWKFATCARVGESKVAHAEIMVTSEAGK